MKHKELIFYLDPASKDFVYSEKSLIPFDESMIIRAWSSFDAIQIRDGEYHNLDAHIYRTYASARGSKICLPFLFSRQDYKKKLLGLKKIALENFGKTQLPLKIEIVISKMLNVVVRISEIPEENPQKGITIIAVSHQPILPTIKNCGRYSAPKIIIANAQEQIDPDIQECLFYDETRRGGKSGKIFGNFALEATSAAFFAVDDWNFLWTARPPHVLPSTTANIILKIAEAEKNRGAYKEEKVAAIMPVGYPFTLNHGKIKEAFLSSTTRKLTKISKIIFVSVKGNLCDAEIMVAKDQNQDIILSGPTPVTDRLRMLYIQDMESHIRNAKKRRE